MTTVIYSNGLMACDSQVTISEITTEGEKVKSIDTIKSKIFYSQGKMFGFAGELNGVNEFMAWYYVRHSSFVPQYEVTAIVANAEHPRDVEIYMTDHVFNIPMLCFVVAATAFFGVFPLAIASMYIAAFIGKLFKHRVSTLFFNDFWTTIKKVFFYKNVYKRQIFHNPKDRFIVIGSGFQDAAKGLEDLTELYKDKGKSVYNEKSPRFIIRRMMAAAIENDSGTGGDPQIRTFSLFKKLIKKGKFDDTAPMFISYSNAEIKKLLK